MKKYVLALTGVLIFFLGRAQESTKSADNFNLSVDSIAEGLVAFAMNGPSVRSQEHLAGFFEWTYRESKTTWMNNIVAQGNLNEYSIKQGAGSDPLKQSTQYPRYNFGISIPLGIFVNNPKQTKADLYKYQSAVDQVNMERQNIRLQVLNAYQEYLTNTQLEKVQNEVVHDYEIIYIKNKDSFTKGLITLEAFNYASMMYHNELTKQITTSGAAKISLQRLEALIGMRLVDAISQISARSNAQQ